MVVKDKKLPQKVVTKKAVVQSAFSSKMMTKDQMNILRTQIAPNISDNDLLYCLEVADNCQLNPILKDIYFVPRKALMNGNWIEKHEPMLGRRGARAIARRKGMRVPPNTGHTIKKFPVYKNGEWIEERDLIGWAELIIDGQTVRKEAAFSVYKQTKKSGEITKFWASMPTVMIEKVAEFQLLDAVYGLDGVMSVDSGLLEDETSLQSVTIAKNKDEIVNAIKSFGLSYKIDNGLLIVEGNTFQHSKSLKELGLSLYQNKWQIRINSDVENDTVETVEVIETSGDKNSATLLFEELVGFGMSNDEIKEFVNGYLGLSRNDEAQINALLDDQNLLIQKTEEFYAEKGGNHAV